jgi:hypothetical protein
LIANAGGAQQAGQMAASDYAIVTSQNPLALKGASTEGKLTLASQGLRLSYAAWSKKRTIRDD